MILQPLCLPLSPSLLGLESCFLGSTMLFSSPDPSPHWVLWLEHMFLLASMRNSHLFFKNQLKILSLWMFLQFLRCHGSCSSVILSPYCPCWSLLLSPPRASRDQNGLFISLSLGLSEVSVTWWEFNYWARWINK